MRNEKGAVTTEFALVLPAVIAVIGLLIGVGWIGTVRVIVDHGAREGLRTALVQDDASVPDAVEQATPLVSPTAVTVTGEPGRNMPVEVEVTYELSNPVAAFLPLPGTITLSARAEGRRE